MPFLLFRRARRPSSTTTARHAHGCDRRLVRRLAALVCLGAGAALAVALHSRGWGVAVHFRESGAAGLAALHSGSPRETCANISAPHQAPLHLPRKRIPRILWQTWVSEDLPAHLRRNVEDLRAKNPEFDYRLVTDRNATALFETHFPGVINSVFRRLMRTQLGAAKADLIRYAVLYVFGGVYVDLDSHCAGLERMIRPDDSAVVSHERGPHTWVQWVLAFEPRHPVLLRLLQIAAERLQRPLPAGPLPHPARASMHEAVVWCTGPWVLAQGLREFSPDFERGLRHEARRGCFGLRAEGKRQSVEGGATYGVEYAPYCKFHSSLRERPAAGYKTYNDVPLVGDTLLPPGSPPQR